MTESNPYSPPKEPIPGSASTPTAPTPNNTTVSEMTIFHLQQTRPWAMFIAILGFISAGFMGLGTLAIIVAGIVSSSNNKSGEVGVMLAVGLIYGAITAIYLMLSITLIRFSSSIGHLVLSKKQYELESVLETQHRFWRLLGICTITGMALTIVTFVVLAAFASTLSTMKL